MNRVEGKSPYKNIGAWECELLSWSKVTENCLLLPKDNLLSILFIYCVMPQILAVAKQDQLFLIIKFLPKILSDNCCPINMSPSMLQHSIKFTSKPRILNILYFPVNLQIEFHIKILLYSAFWQPVRSDDIISKNFSKLFLNWSKN